MDHGEHLMNHPEHWGIDWGAYYTPQELESWNDKELHHAAHLAQAFLHHIHYDEADVEMYAGEWYDTPAYATPWYEEGGNA